MDESVLVQVLLPTAKVYLDVRLSLNLKVREVLMLLLKHRAILLKEGCDCSFHYLYHQRDHCILDKDQTLQDVNIQTGDCLFVF